ncbi:hypothetical protein ACFR9U_14390 [Halorientalis brevis]|uniref:Archaeal Type IV pilin N-terminal domain-containing protein n=1 Tax=Halorientalis brevis TaxID=1126241 RepID=A0ABD6CED9_9EURY|nr:hypothetical protein [Halorientalis brevis]
MREWITPRLKIAVVAACILALGGFYLTGNYLYSPCQDTLAFSAPVVDMNVSYESSTGAIDVTYHSGDELTAELTEGLSLVILDSETDAKSTYSLANSSADFPITPGRTFHLTNATVNNQPLTLGDEIVVVLHTHETPLPGYCRNSRTDNTLRFGTGRITVEQGDVAQNVSTTTAQ